LVDQQLAAAAAQRQQAQAEIAKLAGDVAALRTQLAEADIGITRERAAHGDTQTALQQRALDVERLAQQVRDLTERLSEHDGFRRSLEEKLQHAYAALEHYRTASKEQREQEARRHEQQVQQLQAELRQVNQMAIVKQNEITQLNRDNARLVAEAGVATRHLREQQAHSEQLQNTLNQALVDHARAKAEYDALQTTARTQATELTQMRAAGDALTADLTKLAAQFDAQQQLLGDYRMRLGLTDAAG
jgi:chromosome segregation ATPase